MKKKIVKKKKRSPNMKSVYPEMNIHPNIYSLLRCATQEDTATYIKEVFNLNGITYYEDSYGNIYNLDLKDVPLLSAHMDTVMRDADERMSQFIFPDDTGLIVNGSIIGGDDKCGIYIIMRILLSNKKVNFVFSKDEEIGCIGIQEFFGNPENVEKVKENCLYCLVLDRNGNSDIICTKNDYGTKEFEDSLIEVSKNHDLMYKSATGTFSDADYTSEFISTANLSVGYFNAHSKNEMIELLSLENALFFTERIIEEVKEKFEAPVKELYSYWNYGGKYYKNKKNNESYFDEYDDFYFNKAYGNAEECDSCNKVRESDIGETVITVYLENGMDINLCPDCANFLLDQLRRETSKYL